MNDEATNNEDLELLMEVSASVDGELSESRREALESRLANDPRFADEARFYRWLDETAKRERAPEVGAPEWAELWTRIDRERARPTAVGADSKIRHVFFRVVVPLAAAAAVVITATLAFRGLDPADAPADNPEVAAPQFAPGNQMLPGKNLANLPDPEDAPENGDGVRAPKGDDDEDDDGPEVEPDPRVDEDPAGAR